MVDLAVNIEHLTKVYKIFDKPTDRIKEALNPFGKRCSRDFFALRDVSLSIQKGETIGIIGTNGSGKSTLLKILSGVLNETSGQVHVKGKISALLELGAGFNMEYSGIENIYLNGTIMGYREAEIDPLVPKIIDFADIGDFINQPVKTYSSGMFVRLAFATQIYSNPDILIVDEALSVGDMRFQQKCYRAMDQMMKDKTVIIVSHDSTAISRFCSRVIWINKGTVMYDGETEEGLNKYQTFLLNNMELVDEDDDNSGIKQVSDIYYNLLPVDSKIEAAGTGEARIVAYGVLNARGELTNDLVAGNKYTFAMDVEFTRKLKNCIVGITVKDRLGSIMFCLNSFVINRNVDTNSNKCQYQIEIVMPKLNQGEYTISPAIAIGSMSNHKQICWLHDAVVFNIVKTKFNLPGIIYLDNGYDIFMKEVAK